MEKEFEKLFHNDDLPLDASVYRKVHGYSIKNGIPKIPSGAFYPSHKETDLSVDYTKLTSPEDVVAIHCAQNRWERELDAHGNRIPLYLEGELQYKSFNGFKLFEFQVESLREMKEVSRVIYAPLASVPLKPGEPDNISHSEVKLTPAPHEMLRFSQKLRDIALTLEPISYVEEIAERRTMEIRQLPFSK